MLLLSSASASFDAVCALLDLQGGTSPQLADHRKRSRSPPVRPAVSAVLGDAGQKPAQRLSPPTTLKPIKSTGASQVHRGAIPRPPSSVKASASKLFQAKPSPLSSQQHHPYQRPPPPPRPPMPPPPLRWSLQPPMPPPQRMSVYRLPWAAASERNSRRATFYLIYCVHARLACACPSTVCMLVLFRFVTGQIPYSVQPGGPITR